MCKIRREWGGGDLPGGMNYSKRLGYQIREVTSLVSDSASVVSSACCLYPLMSPRWTFRVVLALDTAASYVDSGEKSVQKK
jgi:hypothetical protein